MPAETRIQKQARLRRTIANREEIIEGLEKKQLAEREELALLEDVAIRIPTEIATHVLDHLYGIKPLTASDRSALQFALEQALA